MQVDVGVSERIVVDVGIGLVDAVGPLRHLFAEAASGVVDHVVDRLLDGVDAVALDQHAETLTRELGRTDLGPQVTDVVGQPVVRRHRVQDVPPLDAPVHHLDDGPAHTLAPDVVGGDVVAARDVAAGVAVMALDAGDEHHAPFAGHGIVAEHRCEHVVVGEVAAAVVRVVGGEDVALAELVDAEDTRARSAPAGST